MIRADAAALDRILADEHTYNQPNGNVASKVSFIALITSGEVKIKKSERYGVTIHVYGDVATMTGPRAWTWSRKAKRARSTCAI